MNPVAVTQSQERLRRAREANERLQRADPIRDHNDVKDAWSAFLIAASGVYSKLEKGAKGHSLSEPWFGRIKHERKTDPLLRYIQQARNSDEHGLSEIVTEVPGHVAVHQSPHPHGPNISITVSLKLILVPVHDDAHGDTFPLPKSHLGQKIMEWPEPKDLSALALEYLDSLVSQAAEFARGG